MKALSIRQPWAHFIVIGEKRVEYRSRPTKYRGILLIHASATRDDWEPGTIDAVGASDGEWTDGGTPYPDPASLSYGCIIGQVSVVGCMPIYQALQRFPDQECFSPGDDVDCYAWVLENATRLTPVACKGSLNFWEVPPEVLKLLHVHA